MAQPETCVAIVDPFSSGAMLAEALTARRATCVAILSSPDIPAFMRSGFDPSIFVAIIEHGNDLGATVDALRRYAPLRVVAGFESGVILADRLGEEMSLVTNGTTLSEARRDKYLMLETARRRGLATPRHFRSRNIESILAWIHEVDWPVILKPPASVASDNVHRCASDDDARRATDAILSERSILGEPNEAVLAQEFLEGTEYVVDAVSVRGWRQATAFWQYHRPGLDSSAPGYDAMTLLPYVGTRQEELQAFAFAAGDALGVDHGPTHCEIMWTTDGPVLIEIAARLTSGINAVLSRICGGICQLDRTVDAILAPERFLAALDDRPSLQQRAANVFLMPPHPGQLTRVRGLDIIEQLPTLHSMSVRAKPGDQVGRVAGMVTLVAEDIHAIERDIRTIRDVERRGLFEVAAAPGN